MPSRAGLVFLALLSRAFGFAGTGGLVALGGRQLRRQRQRQECPLRPASTAPYGWFGIGGDDSSPSVRLGRPDKVTRASFLPSFLPSHPFFLSTRVVPRARSPRSLRDGWSCPPSLAPAVLVVSNRSTTASRRPPPGGNNRRPQTPFVSTHSGLRECAVLSPSSSPVQVIDEGVTFRGVCEFDEVQRAMTWLAHADPVSSRLLRGHTVACELLHVLGALDGTLVSDGGSVFVAAGGSISGDVLDKVWCGRRRTPFTPFRDGRHARPNGEGADANGLALHGVVVRWGCRTCGERVRFRPFSSTRERGREREREWERVGERGRECG